MEASDVAGLDAVLPGEMPGAPVVMAGALAMPVGAGLAEVPGAGVLGTPTTVPSEGAWAVLPGETVEEVVCGADITPLGAGEAVWVLCAPAIPVVIIKAVDANHNVFILISYFTGLVFGLNMNSRWQFVWLPQVLCRLQKIKPSLSFQKSKTEMTNRKFMTGFRKPVMRLSILLLLILIVWVGGFGLGHADMAPQRVCEVAGHAAEQAGALPTNMLVSIGLVESGRVDQVTGQAMPWPWTVNADGAGHYFSNEQDAAAYAQFAESSGARDVDVGCFQISLENHPDAFGSMDAAFDPVANANFAARFLNRLKMQRGSWDAAIAAYHSGLPELGLPYQRLVLRAWQGIDDGQPALTARGFAQPDPVVILEAPAARLVRVFTFNDLPGPPLMAGLPQVITP